MRSCQVRVRGAVLVRVVVTTPPLRQERGPGERQPFARPWPWPWPRIRDIGPLAPLSWCSSTSLSLSRACHPSTHSQCTLTASSANIAVLQSCSIGALQLGSLNETRHDGAANTRSKSTAPRPPSISSDQHPELRPSMGSPVAPLPCTSNRRVGCFGRFLRRRVTGRSLLLRRVSC
jgi:hypothetical protein